MKLLPHKNWVPSSLQASLAGGALTGGDGQQQESGAQCVHGSAEEPLPQATLSFSSRGEGWGHLHAVTWSDPYGRLRSVQWVCRSVRQEKRALDCGLHICSP